MKGLKAILGIGIAVYAVVALFMIGPVYVNYLGFKDAVDEEARSAAFGPKGEKDIRADLDKQIADYKIPLTVSDMTVEKKGNEVTIAGDYEVHVDLPLHPVDLHFHVGSNNSGSLTR